MSRSPAAARQHADRGFTLLETMVAFAVVALVLGAAYASLSAGARASHRAETALAALTRAEATMARIGADIPLVPGRQGLVDGDWSLDIQIAPALADRSEVWSALGRQPYELRVAVSPTARPGDGETVLTTLRIGPALGQQGRRAP